MLKLLINGCNGKMGQVVSELAKKDEEIEIVGGFDISKRELEVSQRLKEYYYLYRIYNLKQNSSDVNYYKVKGALDKNYDLEATGFRAYRKDDIEDEQ